MLKFKGSRNKKDHLPVNIRKELGEYIIRVLLRKHPELSVVQLRRIFCYSYFSLSKADFKEYCDKQRRLINEEDN